MYEQPLASRQKRDRWYSTPLLAGERIYCVGRQTGTYVIAAKPQFELLATNVISDDDSISNASPAVSDGQIFLRSNKYAYCFGKSDTRRIHETGRLTHDFRLHGADGRR
ncbi:MAG: hypothetical protein R3F31_08470 [Verrucomicrobiales bacterium]